MSDYLTISACRSCGSADLEPVLSLGVQHVSNFCAEGDWAKGPQVPIDLVLCRGCTLVQQRHTAPQDFLYTRHYWYRSGVTATMRAALRDVADCAVAELGDKLKGGDVVLDIGANDGTLLGCYPESLLKVACEPAENLYAECRKRCDIFIRDFWSGAAWQNAMHKSKARIITAIGMFYDLEDPNQFMAGVAEALAPDGVFVAQLMCLKQTVENRDVGNLCHEHLEFYSLRSLQELYWRHGLYIYRVEENKVNGGSYRVWARKGRQYEERPAMVEAMVNHEMATLKLGDPDTYHQFGRQLAQTRELVRDLVHGGRCRGRQVWVYGASTKGNVILQWLGLDHKVIGGASDRSPEKWGKHTAGTGIRIYSEEAARQLCPDWFLVLPYAFLGEFLEREKDWRSRGGRFIVPLPELRVV